MDISSTNKFDQRQKKGAALMRKEDLLRIFTNMPQLETERLLFRRMLLADAEDMYAYARLPEVTQYLTWNEDMLVSYIEDFKVAMERGWNLITEKYGRMMESTAPARFKEIKEQFPVLSEDKKKII